MQTDNLTTSQDIWNDFIELGIIVDKLPYPYLNERLPSPLQQLILL
jgi:hypothetical protein